MQLNLPILDQLTDSHNILIAGAGGGFDVFCGLPIYFALKALGKTVHLANYSFTEFALAKIVSDDPIILADQILMGVRGALKHPLLYFPEGYLAQWFRDVRHEEVIVWMLGRTGVAPLIEGYQRLTTHLGIDAIILVDGGVDSLMRGDEEGSGTLLEDTVSLTAVETLSVPVKLLACIGFGTEVEEQVCHHHALENMAALIKAGAFLGSCALTAQMEAFQLFEAAARYVWEQPEHPKSHISTRVIPAVRGEFGNHHMYDEERRASILVSPLMSLYWFFDAGKVIHHSLLAKPIRHTQTLRHAFQIAMTIIPNFKIRPRRALPY